MREEILQSNRPKSAAEAEMERVLRPQSLADFTGQEKMVENLRIFIEAAKQRGEALDHTLLHGPPGLGKTTLSHIIANELGVNVRVTSGPVFTLVGATTRSGLLSAPLRSRFGITCRLEYYDAKTLSGIIKRSAKILNVPIDDEGANEISRRSRGTPRIANALLRRVRDFAQIKGNGSIDLEISQIALSALNVDANGLDEMDNRILSTIIEKFKGGPVGLSTIATAVGEESGTIEEVYEPFLIMQGYIKRTSRGREATERAFKHLGVIPGSSSDSGTLF